MAYDASVPVSTSAGLGDLTKMQENFNRLRQFFMTGVAPVHGATIAYGYTDDKCTSITFGGTLAGSASFTYSGYELQSEVWTIYGATITVTHTFTGGKLTGSAIAIT